MDCETRLRPLTPARFAKLAVAKWLTAIMFLVGGVFFATPANALDTKNGEGVYIVPGSAINLVAATSNIPIQIKNVFTSDVKVHVHVQPTNPRVIVPSFVEVNVPGQTSVTAKVPVEAVGNGQVVLRVWLSTFSGVKLGKESLLRMNVNADLEEVILFSFGGLIAVLLALGVARTISKSRRKTLGAN